MSSEAADRDPGRFAERVRTAALGVPGVVELSGGVVGELATYLPGRRVTGVRTDAAGTHVHVVLAADARLPQVAGDVHAAVAAVVDGTVHVHVEDLAPAGRMIGATLAQEGS